MLELLHLHHKFILWELYVHMYVITTYSTYYIEAIVYSIKHLTAELLYLLVNWQVMLHVCMYFFYNSYSWFLFL